MHPWLSSASIYVFLQQTPSCFSEAGLFQKLRVSACGILPRPVKSSSLPCVLLPGPPPLLLQGNFPLENSPPWSNELLVFPCPFLPSLPSVSVWISSSFSGPSFRWCGWCLTSQVARECVQVRGWGWGQAVGVWVGPQEGHKSLELGRQPCPCTFGGLWDSSCMPGG